MSISKAYYYLLDEVSISFRDLSLLLQIETKMITVNQETKKIKYATHFLLGLWLRPLNCVTITK